MADFYCIKLISKDGTKRGWLIDRPHGIEICVGGVISDITQFSTEQDALKFIRERKIERNGIKAYVRTNLELMDESIKDGATGISTMPTDKETYHLENHLGDKLFYDSKIEAYYFKKMGDFGFPVWEKEEHVRAIVKEAKFQQAMIFMVKNLGGKQEKTAIQVYGKKKNPDGTSGEFEHIELEAGGNLPSNPFDNTVN